MLYGWVTKFCEQCKKEMFVHKNRLYCLDCSTKRAIQWSKERCKTKYGKKQRKAMYEVRKSVLNGDLPKLNGSVLCVDCERPAKHYDHRDYNNPLDVEPVCVSCNCKRGPALS